MAFGFGVSDLIAAINLALMIWNYGFNEENAADVRYMSFKNDILNFRYLLEKLNDALASAQQRYLDRRSTVLTAQTAYEPLSDDIEAERRAIVGNFLATLTECEKLLEENKQLRRRSSNVLENLRWNLLQQETRVDDLRRRLHFHSEKIRLVLDRLSVTLLRDIDARVDDILAVSEQTLHVSREIQAEVTRLRVTLLGYIAGQGVSADIAPEDSHVVSDLIGQKLSDCLFIHAPAKMVSGIPIIEGFDALLLHYQQSIEGKDHSPEKYLAFLKTRWLLAQLKDGDEYRRARPGFYYKRAINQIEQAIWFKIQQPGELIAFNDSTLVELQESCFHIWPTPVADMPVQYSQAHPLHVRANEERIVTIAVASGDGPESESITVFKSSDERLRIVLKTTLASAPGETVVMPQPVFVREDKMIPRYAMPTMHDDCLEIAIFSRNEEMLYRFNSFDDLFKFQAALIGYEVSHHQNRVQFQFSSDVRSLDCIGRVQLWQDPIPLPNAYQHRASERPLSPGTRDSSSYGILSRRDSILPSLAVSSTINPVQDGWEAQPIKLPAITIFTQITQGERKGRFAIIYIELEEGISINLDECKCCRDYNSCSNLVLTSKRKHFPVRVLYSDVDASTGSPDPNTFDLFPLRLPRHPDFDRINTRQTGYLLLKFKNLQEKKLFHDELKLRFQIRQAQIQDRIDFESKFRWRADRPQRRQASHGTNCLPPNTHLVNRPSFASEGSSSTVSPARDSTGNMSSTPTTPEPGPSNERYEGTTAPPSGITAPPPLNTAVARTTTLPYVSSSRNATRPPEADWSMATPGPQSTNTTGENSELQMESAISRPKTKKKKMKMKGLKNMLG